MLLKMIINIYILHRASNDETIAQTVKKRSTIFHQILPADDKETGSAFPSFPSAVAACSVYVLSVCACVCVFVCFNPVKSIRSDRDDDCEPRALPIVIPLPLTSWASF